MLKSIIMEKILYCTNKTQQKISLPFSFEKTSKIKNAAKDSYYLIILEQDFIRKIKKPDLKLLSDKICFVHLAKQDKASLEKSKKIDFFDHISPQDSKAEISFKLKRASKFFKLKKRIKNLEGHLLVKNKKIERMRLIDISTGCYNWRYFLNRAHQELSSSRRHYIVFLL